jgi:hypothetical protein
MNALRRAVPLMVVVLFIVCGMVTWNPAVGAQAPSGRPAAGDSQAAPPVPRYEVRRATSPVVIDGRLDEPAWQAASSPAMLQALWDFQTGPVQATAVRMLWTDEALYVGYEVEDADITAQHLDRDDPTYQDDAVEIFVNPRSEQTGLYYGLEMNARAVLYDYVMYAPGDARYALKWFDMKDVQVASYLRGTLNARGDIDQGWSLEVAIPLSNFLDLAPRPAVGTIWKANLNRWDGVAPDRRMSIWSNPLQTRSNPHVPARFGELHFVE